MTDPHYPEPGDGTTGATTIAVDAGRFLWAVFLGCLIVEVALVYLDLTVNWLRWSDSGAIRRLFNITREDGLASWFAVSQTLIVAMTAWLLFLIARRQASPARRRTGWLVIAVFFTYMCVDDGAAVHERLGTAFEEGTGAENLATYAWQYLLLPFFAVMGVFVLYFLWWEMPRAVDRLKVAAALGCFALAVAMDFVEGMDDGYRLLVARFGWENDVIRHFSKSVEEFIEMVGMSLFLVTFLGRLAAVSPRLTITFDHRGG